MPRRHQHTHPPSPGSYLGESLLVDMVHHHHLVIKRSTRPSRAAEGGEQQCQEVQAIYTYANSHLYPWRAVCSLLLTPGSKWLKLSQVEPSALGQHSQQHPNHWDVLGKLVTKHKSLGNPELRGCSIIHLALKNKLIFPFL